MIILLQFYRYSGSGNFLTVILYVLVDIHWIFFSVYSCVWLVGALRRNIFVDYSMAILWQSWQFFLSSCIVEAAVGRLVGALRRNRWAFRPPQVQTSFLMWAQPLDILHQKCNLLFSQKNTFLFPYVSPSLPWILLSQYSTPEKM